MAMADPSTTTPPSTNNAASLVDTRKTMVFTYGFMFSFIAFSLFFLFHPSLSASPWLHHIVSLKSSSFFSNSSSSSSSHFSSLLSHFLPPNSSSDAHFLSSSQNTTTRVVNQTQIEIGAKNGTFSSSSSNYALRVKDNVATLSHSTEAVKASSKVINGSSATVVENQNLPQKAGFNGQDVNAETGSEKTKRKENSPSLSHSSKDTASSSNTNGGLGRKVKGDANGISNSSSVLPNGKAGNGQMIISEEEGKNTLYESMLSCDIFDGKWVRDDSYPPYSPGSCPHIDEPFNCFLNGRPDTGYEKYRWQPNNCNIPRLNGKDMLELLRGKRLVFVGDSLNRNMWESLVCALRNSVQDKSRVFEASGKKEFRTEGSYSFIFKDYDCSVEFFRSPFLVQEWEMPNTNGSKIETLRLDLVERSSNRYKDADILIFNTGHWWTHEKTSRGQDYYQEGRHVYGRLNVIEAFRKALTTWARWVDANVNPMKTEVFFRGYSASHFRGGRWNSGGKCEKETEPFKNERFLLKYPPKMKVLESVLKGMKTPVYYLNITRLTDYRKDAHPAVYRAQHLSEEERRSPLRYQDCSHWCLPGVPDTWNELVYARLLIRHYQKQNEEQHHQDQHR